MIILPAIDILDGKCVRLVRGEYDTASKVAESPIDTAKYFADCGAEYIHMVDLNGAKEGKRINSKIFTDVANSVNIPVELGGGIRDMETIEYYIENGISRVILGSVALTNKELVAEAVAKYKEKIAVGIDAKDRKVKTAGWLIDNEVDFVELSIKMAELGVANIIYTNISLDGTLAGVDIEHYRELNNAVNIDITASGGVRDIEDIKRLRELDVYGVICGKAIYSGTLDLKEAVLISKNKL